MKKTTARILVTAAFAGAIVPATTAAAHAIDAPLAPVAKVLSTEPIPSIGRTATKSLPPLPTGQLPSIGSSVIPL